MPLLKSAGQEVEDKPITDHPQPEQPVLYDGVPLDLYGFFYTSFENTTPADKDKLRDLYDIAKGSDLNPPIGKILSELSKLEGKLGMAGYEKRIDRLWNYAKLRRKINDYSKQKKAMEKK